MTLPLPGDYIDFHVHGGKPGPGIFILETLMAHEERLPVKTSGTAFTFGIHPWFLNEDNEAEQLRLVSQIVRSDDVIAIGEAGFDKLRGPAMELQERVFMKQAEMSEALGKPLIIHCVRAWDEVLLAKKRINPSVNWMIHGFRGKPRQAEQLLSKGFYLSVWFEYVLRPESAGLLSTLPADRFFLETDGADADIRDIYGKVAADRQISVEELKKVMFNNYMKFFAR